MFAATRVILVRPVVRYASSSAAAGAGGSPMVNTPSKSSPYASTVGGGGGGGGGGSDDGGVAGYKEPSWRSRLSRLPLVGRFVEDPDAVAREKQIEEHTKKAAASMPRRPGVKLPNPTLYISSPNLTVDPYEPPKSDADGEDGAAGSSWWSSYRESASKASRNTMAVVAIKKEMDGFTTEKFEDLAGESYVLINDAVYSRDVATVRQLTTEKMYTEFKRQIKAAAAAKRSYEWSLDEYTVPPEIMQSRAFPLRDDDDIWAQLTVKLESLQSLTVIAEDSGEIIKAVEAAPVVEYWVFERRLRAPEDTNWRLCDRLTN